MIAPHSSSMRPTPLPLEAITRETSDTVTFRLDASKLPGGLRFSPGQFTMLYLFGVGEVPISISGDPEEPLSLVHTIRAVGGVTKAIAARTVGDFLGVRGPFGAPWPLEAARGKDLLILCGGLGLAPLRPIIYYVLRHREEFQKISLLYGARTPEDLVFREELPRWRGLDLYTSVDLAGQGWDGHVGVVTSLLPFASFEPERSVAFLCGPEVMMRFAARELLHLGVSPQQIYTSLERNMKCALGFCGHCQYGPSFVCKDGPVFRYDVIAPLFLTREI